MRVVGRELIDSYCMANTKKWYSSLKDAFENSDKTLPDPLRYTRVLERSTKEIEYRGETLQVPISRVLKLKCDGTTRQTIRVVCTSVLTAESLGHFELPVHSVVVDNPLLHSLLDNTCIVCTYTANNYWSNAPLYRKVFPVKTWEVASTVERLFKDYDTFTCL